MACYMTYSSISHEPIIDIIGAHHDRARGLIVVASQYMGLVYVRTHISSSNGMDVMTAFLVHSVYSSTACCSRL